ncbi:drug resistance transporter, EmrB/QacA subfamily [Abditibacterium utsteinense]|uniref:Drug resistance transporter, EmrB/QacA subfamily n=1 Tax=Abditibacterium utsteinense TaxID=1960156 RepID=A0A2S8SXB2_9BACT|nr:MFS transporter [Abditibacterium utsteinense]PQV65437.1 drug resistance transporter, EmrB/QacA subfamily [Abditibacterium utsteinense]
MTSTPFQPKNATYTPDPKRWIAFAVILSATLLGVLDFLIVNLALPSIKKTIGATDAQVQLTVAVYGLSFAVCLITGGRLGDLFGRRRIFQIGMAGFTFSSALCGFSQTPAQLVGFRVIQGAFAALMSPQVLATIQVTFQGVERDKATGYVGATVGVGSFLGNVLGGWLVSANLFGLEWRPIFFVNVPIGIIALVLSAYFVRESKSERAQKLDVAGALISGAGLFALIFPIAEGRQRGWPAWCFLLLGVSAIIGFWFFQFEKNLAKRGGSPLVSLDLFENKAYGRGLASILLLFCGVSSFSFVMGQFLQRGLKMSPEGAGIVFGALSLSFLISSLGAVKLVARIGPKVLLVGLTILQFGQLAVIVMVLIWKGNLNGFWLMPVFFVYGLGQGLTVPQVIRQTMNTVTSENAGAGSGVLSTVQQIAFSLGVSLIGGVFFSIADQGGSPDAFARGLVIAFGLNFVFVLVARVLVAKNLKLNGNTSLNNEPVILEA